MVACVATDITLKYLLKHRLLYQYILVTAITVCLMQSMYLAVYTEDSCLHYISKSRAKSKAFCVSSSYHVYHMYYSIKQAIRLYALNTVLVKHYFHANL
ncbi:hypothetical protein UFOVP975_70 [uncultured Caudovirales phage]|uniref:Uncharacterized protein n=1 Tax=uncultured Caudovirales phage TaxID=2100421 RepID=A0A6J5PRY0_9CAUD|nr:hypothetical protein UFOVP975_70 [uncultured Caudovirales phage]